jgi:hypothetical protein
VVGGVLVPVPVSPEVVVPEVVVPPPRGVGVSVRVSIAPRLLALVVSVVR